MRFSTNKYKNYVYVAKAELIVVTPVLLLGGGDDVINYL